MNDHLADKLMIFSLTLISVGIAFVAIATAILAFRLLLSWPC